MSIHRIFIVQLRLFIFAPTRRVDVSWKNDIVEIYEIIVEINLDQGAKNQTSNSSFVVFLYSLNDKIRIFRYFLEKK